MGGMLHLHIDGPFTQVQLVLIPNVAVEPPVPTAVGAQRAQRKTRCFQRVPESPDLSEPYDFQPWSEVRSTDPGSLCEFCGELFGLRPGQPGLLLVVWDGGHRPLPPMVVDRRPGQDLDVRPFLRRLSAVDQNRATASFTTIAAS